MDKICRDSWGFIGQNFQFPSFFFSSLTSDSVVSHLYLKVENLLVSISLSVLP